MNPAEMLSTDCPRGQIFVLDDNHLMRSVLVEALTPAGYEVISFSDRPGLLAAAAMRAPACVLLDAELHRESGLHVLSELREENYYGPVVMISGRSDVATALSAIQLGAADFVERPFGSLEIAIRVNNVIAASRARPSGNPRCVHFPGRELLSDRELDVLELLVGGSTSKETARVLGLSPRTVEDHRMKIIRKLGARRGTDLVRMVMAAGYGVSERPAEPVPPAA